MPDPIVINTSFNGVPALEIRRPECTALVSLLGGQVMSFQPAGERPVLWHNPDLVWTSGQALRQGIPICWPWFGTIQTNPAAVQDSIGSLCGPLTGPAHGLARSALWSVQSAEAYDTFTEICLALESPPHGTALSVRYRFGQTLDCELITHNIGDTSITLSMALHTYLPVSDIEMITVEGLDGCRYIDALTDWSEHRQSGALRFSAETDRIYQGTPAKLILLDPGWRRRIELVMPNSRSAVIWNPWTEKSQRLSQFGPESFRTMVCIETARVMDDVVTLTPGTQSSLSLTITSRSFDNS